MNRDKSCQLHYALALDKHSEQGLGITINVETRTRIATVSTIIVVYLTMPNGMITQELLTHLGIRCCYDIRIFLLWVPQLSDIKIKPLREDGKLILYWKTNNSRYTCTVSVTFLETR